MANRQLLRGLVLASFLAPVTALGVEPADIPLASGTIVSVKPNVMLVLDDSGSMNSEVMPDDLEDWPNAVGRRSAQCSSVYFNPAVTYTAPVNYDGSSFADHAITAACSNGYDTATSCAVNLTTSFRAGRTFTGTNADATNQAAYYYVYTGTQLDSNGKLDSVGDACKTKIDGTRALTETPITYNTPFASGGPGGGTWTRVLLSTQSAAQQANFGNWYSYYRTRLMMMKAAAGRAFQSLSNKYRVGFITINPNNPVSADKFLSIRDFETPTPPATTSQKTDWYTLLYGQTTNGSTPLREALSRVGRYYAGKTDGINDSMIDVASTPPKLDPVQYSCQQNFTILTTDGYWNGNSGKTINATTMGSTSNFDGVFGELDAHNTAGTKFAISPYGIYDGASETRTTVDKENEYRVTSTGCSPVNIGTILQESTSQLQEQVTRLTASTASLQTRAGVLQTCPKSPGNCGASDWSNTASCTWDTSGSSRRSCRYVWGSWTNTLSTCTKAYSSNTSNGTVWSGNGTDCGYTAYTAPAAVASCTAATASSSNPYNVITARTCNTQVITPYHPVTACNATTVPNGAGETTQCSYTPWSTPVDSPSCSAVAQSSGPNYTVAAATQCANNPVTMATQKMQFRTFTNTTTAIFSGTTQVGSSTSTGWTPASPSWTDITGTSCTRVDQATVPYNPIPSRRRPLAAESPTPTAPCTEWPCTSSVAGTGGSVNSLSDVAQYYYVNDLRPNGTTGEGGIDVSENNVPRSGEGSLDDKATWQHMTTFTLGLGLAGELDYRSDYRTASTGHFAEIRAGTRNWPVPPNSTSLVPSKLDDLWHAAVNGRGQFFSAADPDTVVTSLQSALAGVNNRVASAAAAATSTLEPVAGDNFAYIAKYITGVWSGDLEAKTIALVNDAATGTAAGEVSAEPVWSAATKLALKTFDACDTRTIKLFRAGGTDNLVDFKWNTYACDGAGVPSGSAVTSLNATEQAYFGSTQLAALGQYSTMTTTPVNQRTLAVGAPMVNFLRGQRGNEGYESGSATAFYRTRNGALGDIVNAQPLYVRAPTRNFTDTGFAAYKAAKAGRAPVVYLAANDGMLHAFNGAADGGDELWAFIPSLVLPSLYRLADTDYGVNHRFFTDGSPISGDIYDTTAAAWKTILVAGLNKGGKGYYALDITDPASPKGLWEFTDADLGYSYGNPIIGKLNDGTWVVFVTSGLNNADGKGYLYVLNAVTGAIRYKIATTAGTVADPSGLTKITGYVVLNADTDLTFNHIYGVDLHGNVWRFDVNDVLGPSGREASLVTQLVDAVGDPQPITTRPVLALVGNDIHLYVGTGRYLSQDDLTDSQVQTVYGIKDTMVIETLPTATIPNVRSALTGQTLVTVGSGLTAVRGFATCNPATNGWYVDLPDPKERVNVDMRRALGSLLVASNVPEPSACRIGGYSWLTNLNLNGGCSSSATEVTASTPALSAGSGSSIGGTVRQDYVDPITGVTRQRDIKVVSTRAGDSLVVGVSLVMIDGKVYAVVQFSDGSTQSLDPDVLSSTPVGRRLTWREIVLP